MIETALYVLFGAMLGWNFPQPTYAKWLQDWVMDKIRSK